MNIILCGLPMSGKTVIGKMVAEALQKKFIDTDQMIEKEYTKLTGKAYQCREIFQREGEAAFRSLEKQQVMTLSSVTNSVIALGGGVLCESDNIKMVKMLGVIIYLKASPKLIWERTKERGIPAFLDSRDPEKAFYALAQKRIPCYESAAAYTIETDNRTKDEIVNEIIMNIGL